MKFLRSLFAIVHKDLLSEMRRRERANTLLFFGVLVVFLFSFAMGTDPVLLKNLAPGFLWLVVLFSSILTLERSFQAEVEEGCLDRLILYSLSPRATFLGKFLTNFIFIAWVQVVILALMFFLFDFGWPKNFALLAAALFLGNLGISTLGTFYAALVTHAKARQALLPLLLFPMLIPLLLASVFITQQALAGNIFGEASSWLRMLVIFDVIFFAACLLVVQELLEV